MKVKPYKSGFVIAPKPLLTADISNNAKIVYLHCIGKPPNWEYSTTNIAKELKLSVDLIRKSFKELISIGYMVATKTKTEKGFFKYEYEFKEIPDVENPGMENTAMDNSTNITDTLITDNNNDPNIAINQQINDIEQNIQTGKIQVWKSATHNNIEYKQDILNNNNTADIKSADFFNLLLIEFNKAHLNVFKYPYLNIDLPKEKKGIKTLHSGLKKIFLNKDTTWWINSACNVFKTILEEASKDQFMIKNLSTNYLASKLNYFQQFLKDKEEKNSNSFFDNLQTKVY